LHPRDKSLRPADKPLRALPYPEIVVIYRLKERFMRRIIRHAGLMLLFGLCVRYAAAAPTDLYREAQIQESSARDLEAASQLYRQFLDQPKTDRALQADAYLHLGDCQAKLGQLESAKTAWKKVVSDYSDQQAPYSQAIARLQEALAAEHNAVVASTPVVQVVRVTPQTRWNLDFLHFTAAHVIDTKGRFLPTTSGFMPNFDYFIKPGRFAVGFSGGYWGFSNGYNVQSPHVTLFNPHVRIERHVAGVLLPYITIGPSIYRFTYPGGDQREWVGLPNYQGFTQVSSHYERVSKWTAGVASEFGVNIGWTRGFTINLGYSLHAFPQVTPPPSLRSDGGQAYPPDMTQNHGLRLIGGPVFGLSFRW
jgi:hypothetical protein